MGTAAGVSPAGDLPIRAETLHETRPDSGESVARGRSQYRAKGAARARTSGPGGERERATLERLRGVQGIVQVADVPMDPECIMLQDIGGHCLADLTMPLDKEELLDLALDLANVVAGLHRSGVIHRDISPANIMLPDSSRTPFLVDFALATGFAEIRPEFTHPNEIVGTLAYLAPEQTGRIGRPVDHCADLYALGATLYELATGRPPFGTGDPLRLSHDHLTG